MKMHVRRIPIAALAASAVTSGATCLFVVATDVIEGGGLNDLPLLPIVAIVAFVVALGATLVVGLPLAFLCSRLGLFRAYVMAAVGVGAMVLLYIGYGAWNRWRYDVPIEAPPLIFLLYCALAALCAWAFHRFSYDRSVAETQEAGK